MEILFRYYYVELIFFVFLRDAIFSGVFAQQNDVANIYEINLITY